MLNSRSIFLCSICAVLFFVTLAVSLGSPVLAETPRTDGFRPVSPETRIPLTGVLHRQPAYGLEWWYVTGHVEGERARFGYELTFFRVGVERDEGGKGEEPFALRNVYLAHFALTDRSGKGFFFDERSSRGAFEEGGADEDRFHVWIRDWSMGVGGNNEDGGYRLRARSGGYAIDLLLRPGKDPVLHGADGYSRKGNDPGEASFYVSWTDLRTEGVVTWKGTTSRVRGRSWMDREITTPVNTPEAVGWDWFAIRIDGGTEIMLYRILRADGSVSPWSAGTWIAPDGVHEQMHPGEFHLRPIRNWTSPESSVRYDTVWEVEIPGREVALTVRADFDHQELRTRRSTRNVYWEGSCTVEGTVRGRRVEGDAYLEMNREKLGK